jgi:hypothetical protein
MCEHRSGLSFVHVFPLKFRGGNCRGLGYFGPSYSTFCDTTHPFCVCSCTKHLTKARDHNTKHKTHNNQHDPPPPYPSAALALSLHLSMATSVMDPNLGATAPYGPTQGSRRRLRSCHCWFLRLGHRNATPRKTERGAGSRPLGGHRLNIRHNNQPEVCDHGGGDVWEDTQLGRKVWG